MGPGALVEHPGSADLSGTMRSEASEVIGRSSRGMGMLNQRWEIGSASVGKRDSDEVNWKALA